MRVGARVGVGSRAAPCCPLAWIDLAPYLRPASSGPCFLTAGIAPRPARAPPRWAGHLHGQASWFPRRRSRLWNCQAAGPTPTCHQVNSSESFVAGWQPQRPSRRYKTNNAWFRIHCYTGSRDFVDESTLNSSRACRRRLFSLSWPLLTRLPVLLLRFMSFSFMACRYSLRSNAIGALRSTLSLHH